MKIQQRHLWSVTVEEAIAIQQQLQLEVITTDRLGAVNYVAGVDVGFEEDGEVSRAAVVVLSFPGLQLQEQAIAVCPTTFPYTPGLLSFREVPVILEALKKLRTTPDLILCDGQGIAHPRRFGLGCHLGLLTEVPTIGVAKSLFIGEHDELALEKGSWQSLRDRGEVIGAVVRSRTNVKPIYISVGHLICLPTAIDYVLRCTPKYRLPQTTRLADQLSRSASLVIGH
ncbi:MAG: deoxyribonuclease V [Symploca sp. SIO1A3]|nr:deoxyribonuclease V [Symploca sp. SIO2C1]NER50755.1 deoxyribonuclease V [Symploca sp. SIO1A3]